MKAIELQGTGREERFAMVERPRPEPRRGELVVRTLAAALNARDHQIASGAYHAAFPLPLVPLSDGVGEIVAVGEDVKGFSVGERVAATFWQRWTAGSCAQADLSSSLGGPIDGMLAEYVRLDERGVVRVPEHLSHEEAAALSCSGVTAWRALVTEGRIRAGDAVWIQGTGGVSTFAMQWSLMHGARALVTSRSPAKLERARALGASACIDARSGDVVPRLLEHTEGAGVDHIVDVGGPQSFVHSLRALRAGGQINVVGYLGGVQGEINPLMLLERQATLRGLQVGPRECFEDMNRAIASQRMRPAIDRVLPWTEFAAALARLRSGEQFGKIVLRVS
jgi:NADPH:quinone reductase-like Zn-dependent oxidoreductase